MSIELNTTVASLMDWEQIDRDTWRDKDGVDHIVGFMTYANFNPAGCENSAGLVLNRIVALGWAVTVFTGGWHGVNLIRCCIMRTPATAEYTADVTADTRPLAICRAFVQAMERWGDENVS